MLRCANAVEYQGHYYKRILIHKLVSFLRFLINGFFKDYTIYFLKAQKSLFQKGKFHAYKREVNERTHICTKKSINNLQLNLNFFYLCYFLLAVNYKLESTEWNMEGRCCVGLNFHARSDVEIFFLQFISLSDNEA